MKVPGLLKNLYNLVLLQRYTVL